MIQKTKGRVQLRSTILNDNEMMILSEGGKRLGQYMGGEGCEDGLHHCIQFELRNHISGEQLRICHGIDEKGSLVQYQGFCV